MTAGQNVSLRTKIREQQPIISAMMRFPDPGIAELLAVLGFDVIVIDNEHMPFNDETIANIARACAAHGVACMIRPTDHNPRQIGRYLDMGLVGILAAHVDTAEQARSIVSAVKYPPFGKRGMMPLSRAATFGMGAPTGEYAARANDETLVICMCESRTGVENIDGILAVEGVDGVAVGPSDIANSYGMPGKSMDPKIVEIISTLEGKIFASGKLASALPKNHDEAVRAVENGYGWINAASDLSLIVESAKRLSPRDLGKLKLGKWGGQ
ncbi:4-hydroxy-2-oxoheptanedioate aldolase [Aminobacter aminovorans]|uniref:2-keto-3-deoxy-L-rhamnonate aldolase n=1 Tax=Aminobacter aminovorans TaxID=83263 RepID=A0A381IK80_AMIAI|nr:aldolase/citrate lyase family protein [Aminobacter aminovorans]TCS25031.1 4-hydroxy-2-oxoheptanedioate aldolase [Aminobacter aminovorans]SUY28513.1 2-keto-3-deoxy-L-rhamnonate aldolase [Aminobacter aminovorans]